MNSKKVAYFLMTLSFIMIVSGGFSSFVINLQSDRRETVKRMNEVSDVFEIFSTNTSVFEASRDELYNTILSNVYFESMYLDDVNIKNKLSNYENLLDQLKKNTNILNKLCDEVYYPKSDINNKCQNYKNIYEQAVNYFVSDINIYNSNVKKYNEYQKSIGSMLVIKEYSTKKTFIDYNGDKKFDGKEDH